MGWRGTQCQKDMYNSCHSIAEIFDDIEQIFGDFEHAIFTILANFYALGKDLFDFWSSCSVGSGIGTFFGNFMTIVKDYPNRWNVIKDHLSCAINNFEQGEGTQTGVCLGQLFGDLTMLNYQ